MSVQLRTIVLTLLLAVLFLSLQQSDAFRHKPSYPSVAALTGTRGGDGDVDEDRKKEFDALLRKAQLDPNVLNDKTNVLSGLGQLLSVPGPLPSLMTVCTMAAVYQSDIFKDGIEAGREAYASRKMKFAKDFEESLIMGRVNVEQFETNTPESRDSASIQMCIQFLGSDFLHASFFSAENFRQQVQTCPFWQGLVKASLITHLGDDCPNFDELLQDSDLWGNTLLKCC